ncbi:hypothetical protein TWF730_008219 [Orbilia blumenaviensis]|uniref:Uncharacterized protein n=1 Tax=Orbilia blumenaviensis TaxID=1796055 RepID=A0AAV9V213_9PEZI
MHTSVPSVPHFAPVLHHASTTPQGAAIDPDFFGSDASIKPTLSSSIRIQHSTLLSPPPLTTLIRAGSIKEPIPAKSEYLTIPAMATDTPPTSVPTSTPPSASSSPHGSNGILGWGLPAEVAFFVSLAVLGLFLPIGLFVYLKRRRQTKKVIDELSSPSTSSSSTDLTLRGSTTRPPTASSWLEMLKHRTETPSPPHANGDNRNEVYYEPPKPISFARRKFCTRLSGRMSEADIEKEVRELDEEVRRRSKLSRSRGQSVGVLPDLEDPCSECAMSYTHDERGHTQPVEGRRGTPIPFLASVELDAAVVAAVVKEIGGEEEEEMEDSKDIEDSEDVDDAVDKTGEEKSI